MFLHIDLVEKALAAADADPQAWAGATTLAIREAALAAFAACGAAVFLLSRTGLVIGATPAAEILLGPDLQIVRGALTPADRDAAEALGRALDLLLHSESGCPPPLCAPRRDGAPVLIYPRRTRRLARQGLAPCAAMLLLRDLGLRPRPREEALRAAFGLTAAEARLAARLAAGDRVGQAAEAAGVAAHTARNQLKAVFAKTGARRQPELVAMLARFLDAPEI